MSHTSDPHWYEQVAIQAAAHPQRTAVVCGSDTITYRELMTLADSVAARLNEAGVGKGDAIAVAIDPQLEYPAVLLGILQIGAAWLPVGTDWPAVRRDQVLSAAQPDLVVADDFIAGIRTNPAGAETDQIGLGTAVQSARDDTCYIMYTSGSTGQPRGVVVTQGSVAGLFADLPDELRPCADEVWSVLHAPTFGFSLWELFGPLTTGGTACIIPPDQRRDPQRWNAQLSASAVTTLSLTPSGLMQWLAADCKLPESVTRIVLSGESVSGVVLDDWFAHAASERVRLYSTYALTETAGRVAWAELTGTGDAGVIGQATADAELLLLDSETLQPVVDGREGELFVAGPMLAAGYLHDAAATADSFLTRDPHGAGARRWHRTGDRAMRREDGMLLFRGRTDTQLKLRGHRIDAAAVEQVLQAHSDVAAAAVVLSDDAILTAFIVAAEEQHADSATVEFWPSLGEYQIYDALLYDFMSADETRVAAYREALTKQVQGRVALDIGTGKDAMLARLCAQAGASHVYAVEVLEDAAASARALISQLGLTDRITVICGDMRSVELPETVDVCTQGIVGNIGSSDGIVPIWNSAARYFAPDFTAVPSTCTTLIAPVRLPDEVRDHPEFTTLAADYTRRVFAEEGREFDVRLCVRNFPADALLAEPAVFEELVFQSASGSLKLSADYSGSASFTIADPGWLDGYLLWTRIAADSDTEVDFLQHQQAWLPVFFPLGDCAVHLDGPSRIDTAWTCSTADQQIFPDYTVTTTLQSGADEKSLTYRTRHHESAMGSTELHRRLHESLQRSAAAAGSESQALQQWLAEQLPAYMIPGQIRRIATLPLNDSRKLDRRQLARMAAVSDVSPAIADAMGDEMANEMANETANETTDELERALSGIWSDVLGKPIGLSDDFFASGGDSIAAVRLTTEVQRLLDDAVFLAGLYDAPDVRRYARWLREHHGAAAASAMTSSKATADLNVDRTAVAVIQPAAEELLPLTSAQRSLWFLQQLYPGNTAANEQFLLRFHGVARHRIETAWSQLVERHDVLRTTFGGDGTDANPLQQKVAAADSRAGREAARLAAVYDYRDSDDPDAELHQLAAREIAGSFDLCAGPLWRVVFVQLSATECVLLVTAQHIVADGLCVPLVRQALYSSITDGDIDPPALQFSDFASWQRSVMSGERLADEVAWWRDRLAGATVDPVPVARSAASADGPETRIPFALSGELTRSLRAFAHREDVSLYVVLLSIWRVWLSRCFEREDFLLGSPATQRTTAQTSEMLGCMVNNIALRNPVLNEQGFSSVVHAEQRGLLAALDHSAVPFEKIVEEIEPPRVFARHPLFQFMFQFEERAPALTGPGGEVIAIDVLPVDRASYWDMELSFTDTGGDVLTGFLGVRSDLFDPAACADWPAGLSALLHAALDRPAAPVRSLPVLSPAQQAGRRAQNSNRFTVPDDSLYMFVAKQADRNPASTAVRMGGERHSYAELAEQSERYSRALHASGVGPDAVVGVCMPRSFATIAMLLAINSRGATWLALDPDYPAARLQLMLADITPQLVVHSDNAISVEVENRLHDMVVPLVSVNELAARAHGVRDVQVMSAPRHICVLFTSGTTGAPKGMLQSHDNVISRCLWFWQSEELSESEVFAHRTSLNFVDAMWEMFGPLLHGATVDIVPAEMQRDFSAQARFVAEREITHLLVFPSALSTMLDVWQAQSPRSLRSVIVTGEATAPALVSRFRVLLPDCRLLNTYGTSENWDICYARLDRRDSEVQVPAGLPVANARVFILDSAMQEMPAGVPGDLYVAGLGVGGGYINRPDLSRDRFAKYPANPEELLFLTGDRAAFNAGGEVVLHGRADRQLKLRGVRIEPGEIEVLANARADIRESAVVLHGDVTESAWLTLYVVADAEPDAAELRHYLAQRLPAAAVPAEVIRLESLPYTPSGKIDVASLAAAQQTAHGSSAGAGQAAPATPTESRLLSIWQQALGRTDIGTHDDFFALRGNSLLATQVIARICDEFSLDLPLASLFEQPTVVGLAAVIDALCWAADDSGNDDDREVLQL